MSLCRMSHVVEGRQELIVYQPVRIYGGKAGICKICRKGKEIDERLMPILKSSDHHCGECGEVMSIIAKDRLAYTIDGTEVIRIKETWKCWNGHTRLKMYGEQPKIIINLEEN